MTGFILIDKPNGLTSFSTANRVRRLLNVKKTGHTGTLDPMATGVLPVAISNATRFIEHLPVHNKSYTAKAKLGMTTDTLDITGKILSESKPCVTREQLEDVLTRYTGDIMQVPPMFSAISKNGQRLYELARQGIEIERESRQVTIFSLKLISFDEDTFTIDVSCSAGTYVRSLIDDIGKDLGCGAVMTELRRTCANGFSIDKCVTLEKLENAVSEGKADELILPVEACFECYEKIFVSPAQARRFSNGGELSLERLKNNYETGIYTVFSPESEFLGLGEILPQSEALSVRRVFVRE